MKNMKKLLHTFKVLVFMCWSAFAQNKTTAGNLNPSDAFAGVISPAN